MINDLHLKYSVFMVLFAIFFQSCNSGKQQAKSVVDEWYQKEIIVPKKLIFKSLGHDTVCSSIFKYRFKVLVYIDSVGCSACKLKLSGWKAIIDSCKLKAYDITFLFVVQSNNYIAFEQKLYTDHFEYPIIYDPNNEFNKLNKLPKEEQFRTFLLDENNRVVLISSPIDNAKMWNLYKTVLESKTNVTFKQTINVPSSSLIRNNTTVELKNDSINLGKFSFSSFKQVSFQLKNTGKRPLIIQSVSTSCGCTVAKYDKKPITQGEITSVVLEYKPNSLGYFSKTADVVCNVPEGLVRLKISGEVLEK